MVEFRKRFPPEAIAAILEASIPKKTDDDHNDQSNSGNGSGNKEEETKAETGESKGKVEIVEAGTATNAFNEASDFFCAVEGYRQRNGFYPKRVLIDKIYRNRETIAWCKERNIQITGPVLGRPPKDPESTKTAKQQEYQDICDRNIVEGEFGTGKRAYGLNRIMAHLPETSFCVIGVALLCLNLTKRLRSLCFDLFFILIKSTRFCCVESQV